MTVILVTNVTHIKCHMSKALLSDHTSGNHSQWNSWRAVERNVGQTACSLTRHLQTLYVWMCDLEHLWFYWICLRHYYLFDCICVWIWFASPMPCFDHQAGIPIVGVFAFTCKEMVQAIHMGNRSGKGKSHHTWRSIPSHDWWLIMIVENCFDSDTQTLWSYDQSKECWHWRSAMAFNDQDWLIKFILKFQTTCYRLKFHATDYSFMLGVRVDCLLDWLISIEK